ncbi:MAG: Tm-1-like ATP-binding domain-containing protein [Verrucomicrobiales bacterium]
MPTIAVLGTLDTKGREHAYVAEVIRSLGHEALLIDAGTTDRPQVAPDIRVTEILPGFSRPADRGSCIAEVCAAMPAFAEKLAASGRIEAVISLGGGGGTSIATAAMRALPLGMPKVMVSTLASGNTAHYLGTSDITMMPAVVDVAGLNRLSRAVFRAAAHAVCAMAAARASNQNGGGESDGEKPLVVASMFGNTTACVEAAKAQVERRV